MGKLINGFSEKRLKKRYQKNLYGERNKSFQMEQDINFYFEITLKIESLPKNLKMKNKLHHQLL